MIVLAVANQKGGSAKTTTTHSLGVVLAGLGWRVLLVDVDPQSSLTGACGVSDAQGASLAEVIGGAVLGSVAMGDVLQELQPGLSLVPSDVMLASVELGLVSRIGRENVLGRALATVAESFDVALLDCPPSLGLLTVNALTAADGVIIPTMGEAVALRALRLFLATLGDVRQALNGDLETLGVVLTFYDGRLRLHQQGLEAIENAGLPVLGTVGRSVRVAEASAVGETVLTFAPKNPQAQAYQDLGEVVDRWLRNKNA